MILVLVLCASIAYAEEEATHSCETVTWTAWGDDEAEQTSLPTAIGNYYLVCDLESVSATAKPAAGTVINLCLNGYNINMGSYRFYYLKGVLGITDCHTEASWGDH